MSNTVLGIQFGVLAAFAYGTFTVPMKGRAANSVDVDPFVFQSYKVFMCFATSWLGLLKGVDFRFTPWGIVTALIWIPGATAGIFGVRNVGIAVSVGTWSAVKVLVSYVVGIIIFGEKVKSEWDTFLTFVLLSFGLVGMSFATSKSTSLGSSEQSSDFAENTSQTEPLLEVQFVENANDGDSTPKTESFVDSEKSLEDCVMDNSHNENLASTLNDESSPASKPPLRFLSMDIPRSFAGICGAVVNGISGGIQFIPLKLVTRDDEKGLSFIMSFGIGAVIVVTCLWILRYLGLVFRSKSFSKAYGELPSFHLRVMMVPGCTAGFLWAIANLGSTFAVTYLGDGVGLSLSSAALVVSGLWGIFYYKEITDRRKICLWFISAAISTYSIVKICQEHK